MEQLTAYLPEALYGLGMLLAGFGGSRWYGRRNGNGSGQNERRIEPTVTLRECNLRHVGIEKELKEGNRRMSGIEEQVRELNNHIIQHFAG